MTGSSIVCFLVKDEPPRDTWRIAATMRPVVEFSKSESKRLATNVYPAHTLYGDASLVALFEGYLTNYSIGDGWFVPLTSEAVKVIIQRFKNEGPGFLATDPLR